MEHMDTQQQFTLRNNAGMEAEILRYGATLRALRVPDRTGTLADVVLGFDDLDAYTRRHPYFGSTVGRYANRIANGRFSLDGQIYQLTCNQGSNHLHGGPTGAHAHLWEAQELEADDGPSLTMAWRSPAGDDGYPGTLTASVTYTLTHAGALRIDYTATTDAPTIVNFTNHSYFNLTGSGDIREHQVMIYADHFLPTDANQIPTGELRPVAGTDFDLRQPTRLGERLNAEDPQVQMNSGFDHTFALRHPPGSMGRAARVVDPVSGRWMEVYTTKPGVQLYTANKLNGTFVGKGGEAYGAYRALCLETQHFPDAPNQPHFPSPVLRPGMVYRHTTIYRFGVDG